MDLRVTHREQITQKAEEGAQDDADATQLAQVACSTARASVLSSVEIQSRPGLADNRGV